MWDFIKKLFGSSRPPAGAAEKAAALRDRLTGLPDLTLLNDRLEGAIARSRRERTPMAVLQVCIDGLAVIRDELGVAFGDDLLRAVAERVQAAVRKVDTVARAGGDEVTVVLEKLRDESDAETIADTIRKGVAQVTTRLLLAKLDDKDETGLLFVRLAKLRTPGGLETKSEWEATASVGIAYFGGSVEVEPPAMLKKAQTALVEAQRNGGNRNASSNVIEFGAKPSSGRPSAA